MQIPEGFGLVTPKSGANAVLLLQAAQNLDVDVALVRTVSGGYVAPTAVIDEYNRLVHDLPEAHPEDEDGNRIPAEDLVETSEPNDGTINEATLDGSNLGGAEAAADDGEPVDEEDPDAADQNASASVDASGTDEGGEDTTAEKQLIEGAEQAGTGSQPAPETPPAVSGTEGDDEDEPVVLPDAKSDTHEDIDKFAADHGITYDGIEAAKCIALGASLVGLAGEFLRAADRDGVAGVIELADTISQELIVTMFCAGAADLAALSRTPLHKSF